MGHSGVAPSCVSSDIVGRENSMWTVHHMPFARDASNPPRDLVARLGTRLLDVRGPSVQDSRSRREWGTIMRRTFLIGCCALAIMHAPIGATATADPIEDFYKGKSLRMIVG